MWLSQEAVHSGARSITQSAFESSILKSYQSLGLFGFSFLICNVKLIMPILTSPEVVIKIK